MMQGGHPVGKTCMIAFQTCFLALFWSIPVLAAGSEAIILWHLLETKHTVIKYQSDEDLQFFHDKVDYVPHKYYLKQLITPSDQQTLEERLKMKIDFLFERVQEILDMQKKAEKVSIEVYHDKQQLQDAYATIFKKTGSLRAWYIFKRNTIYITVEDIHEGMLAHEIAHAVIDNYLEVRPPSATAEILARYVDRHLAE